MFRFRKKHTFNYKKLEEEIKEKEKEINDIKILVSDVLGEIKNLSESNDYGNQAVYKRKISELCKDTIYNLFFNFSKKERTIITSKNK